MRIPGTKAHPRKKSSVNMEETNNKEEDIPAQGPRNPRARRGGDTVPVPPPSSSHDGRPAGLEASPAGESAIAGSSRGRGTPRNTRSEDIFTLSDAERSITSNYIGPLSIQQLGGWFRDIIPERPDIADPEFGAWRKRTIRSFSARLRVQQLLEENRLIRECILRDNRTAINLNIRLNKNEEELAFRRADYKEQLQSLRDEITEWQDEIHENEVAEIVSLRQERDQLRQRVQELERINKAAPKTGATEEGGPLPSTSGVAAGPSSSRGEAPTVWKRKATTSEESEEEESSSSDTDGVGDFCGVQAQKKKKQ